MISFYPMALSVENSKRRHDVSMPTRTEIDRRRAVMKRHTATCAAPCFATIFRQQKKMAENRHLFNSHQLEFVGQLYFGEVVEVSAVFGFRAECAETFEFDVFSNDYAEACAPGFGVVQVFPRTERTRAAEVGTLFRVNIVNEDVEAARFLHVRVTEVKAGSPECSVVTVFVINVEVVTGESEVFIQTEDRARAPDIIQTGQINFVTVRSDVGAHNAEVA